MNKKITILIAAAFSIVQLHSGCTFHRYEFAGSNSQEDSGKVSSDQEWINQHAVEILKNTKDLDEDVLRLALSSYKQAVDKKLTESPILSVVDFSKISGTPRLWVIDLFQNRVLFHELVAHGKNSGTHEYATRFSNKHGSLQSSLGLFLTGQPYFGSRGYSLTLHGLNKGINDNAEDRGVIMHGAHYVNDKLAKERGSIGRSLGCLSVRQDVTKTLIDTIKKGTLIYAYHPQLLSMA